MTTADNTPAKPSTPLQAMCPECGSPYAVTRDGKLASHTTYVANGWRSAKRRCVGSGGLATPEAIRAWRVRRVADLANAVPFHQNRVAELTAELSRYTANLNAREAELAEHTAALAQAR